jgi:hypothetical protein
MKKIISLIPLWILLIHAGHTQIIWEQVAFPFPDTSIISMKADNNGTIIIGLQKEVYYSPDNGISWYPSSDWPDYYPMCIGFNSSHQVFIGIGISA